MEIIRQLLLRLVDDFLFISTERAVAERFLNQMHAGHPEYGCFISTDKTLVNFDFSLDKIGAVKKVPKEQGFPWCGLLLNQKTLDVQYEYARFQNTHIANSLTVRTHKRPGEAFSNMILQ